MTPEEQRIAIAEYCGIKPNTMRPECYGSGYGASEMDHDPCFNCQTLGEVEPYYDSPDYLNDLNAMREIEKSLTTGQKIVYADWLCAIQKRDPHVACWDLIHASAAVKSEAVLRTLCKWKD